MLKSKMVATTILAIHILYHEKHMIRYRYTYKIFWDYLLTFQRLSHFEGIALDSNLGIYSSQ